LGAGPAAPHQAETLREVAAQTISEEHRSPRLSSDWDHEEQQYGSNGTSANKSSSLTGANLQQQDALAVAQNGGHTGSMGEDADMADAEGDDGMDDDEDDDMMDKISSSPSIDDGGYSLPQPWPARTDSLSPSVTPQKSPFNSMDSSGRPSSPLVDALAHFPIRSFLEQVDSDFLDLPTRCNLPSKENAEIRDSVDTSSSNYDNGCLDISGLVPNDTESIVDSCDDDFESGPFEDLLEVQGDLELDSSLVDHYDYGSLTLPYDSGSEDDDDEFPYPTVSRFIDSGWGGECLQESEDIDFEFVYALHTFVATVEGQANATKGDTMVLLDDSNSYWWLVRVVKDSSIGETSCRVSLSDGKLIDLGYLPAEHIETPTERLARLNKHRNIDVRNSLHIQSILVSLSITAICNNAR
jgi:hypothetical protein